MNIIDLCRSQTPGTIQTIAGVGRQEGIPARDADAGWPLGVVRSAQTSELIIADYHMNLIWRIDGDGILHKFAGTGVPGYNGDGGSALDAALMHPHDLTQDKHGNIYFSDLDSQVYRKIDWDTGIITTVAGSGKSGRGGDLGPALKAEMDTHCGIAIAENGDIYISSEWSNNIRRIDAQSGQIEIFAGHDARHHPSESGNSRPAHGEWLSLGGYSGDGGPKELAGFYQPEHLAFDSKGDLYVCDNANNRIRKIDMNTGIVSTVLGNGQFASNGDNGPAIQASTLMPDALFIDNKDNIYVGEKYGFRVRKIDGSTGIVTTIAGTGVPGMGAENVPATSTECNSVEVGMWVDTDETVFFSDCGGRLRRIDAKSGLVTTVLGGTSVHDEDIATNAFLCGPRGIDTDLKGNIYVADQWNQRIRVINPDTGIINTAAGNGSRAYGGDGGLAENAYLGNPTDVSIDSHGRIVIADYRHGHVRRVDNDGIIHNIAGAAFKWDKGDHGPAINANLVSPASVAHDKFDNIYIGDDGASRIRKIDSDTGIIQTIAGNGMPGYTGDNNLATEACIGHPMAIALDLQGNLFFADALYNVIRRVDINGIITTVVGTGEKGFSDDGTLATETNVNSPSGVIVSKKGLLYFSDTLNHRVRKIGTDGTIETIAGSGIGGYSQKDSQAITASLTEPYGLCFYNDSVLLIADWANHIVRSIKI